MTRLLVNPASINRQPETRVRFTGHDVDTYGAHAPRANGTGHTLADGIAEPPVTERGVTTFLDALDNRYLGYWTRLCQSRWSHSMLGSTDTRKHLVKSVTDYAQQWYSTPLASWLDRISHSLVPRLFSHDPARAYQWDFYHGAIKREPKVTPTGLPKKVQAAKDDTELSEHVIDLFRRFEEQKSGKGLKRAAWYKPSGEVNTLGQQFLDLLKQRNTEANAGCHLNYYDDQLLRAHGQDPYHWRRLRGVLIPEAQAALRKLDKVTRHEGYIRAKGIWDADLLDALNAIPFDVLIRRTAAMMGINQEGVSRMVNTSSLLKGVLRNKTNGWYCEPVNPPFDVRVMTNIPVNPKERTLDDYQGLLHEIAGHGFDYLSLDPTLPFAARMHHDGASVETMAIHFETLLFNPEWLDQVVGMPKEYIERRKDMLEVARRSYLLRMILESSRSDLIEETLYKNANKKEDTLERAIQQELTTNGFEYPLKKRGGQWLNDQRFILDYVAYHPNYAMAALNALFLNDHANAYFNGMANANWYGHLALARHKGRLTSWEDQWAAISGTEPLSSDDVRVVIAAACNRLL